MLFRMLQAPLPFVMTLLPLLLLVEQLDMQLPCCCWPRVAAECRSAVLLLFVEAVLIS